MAHNSNNIFIPFSLLLILSATSKISHAQDSPQDYVNAHNVVRAEVFVGPIKWDKKVATFARNHLHTLKENCSTVYYSGQYGENMESVLGDGVVLTGTMAVKEWAMEKPYYDHESNKCVIEEEGIDCSSYVQLVWRDSVRLGCAKVKCDKNRGIIVACYYDPPGNIPGQSPY